MANIAQQRIQREFREVVKSKEIAESGVQLQLVNDDLTELAGSDKACFKRSLALNLKQNAVKMICQYRNEQSIHNSNLQVK